MKEKDLEKVSGGYISFTQSDESCIVGSICDDKGNLLTNTALYFDGPIKFDDYIKFINDTKKTAEKLNCSTTILTGEQFEKRFPGKILF